MGEVLKFPGGAPKPRDEAPAPNEERAESYEDDIVSVLMPTVLYLTALKNSDPRSFNLANIAERRKLLAKLNDDSLERELRDGNELSWKQRPSWYHALIAEIRSRDMLPGGYGSIVDMFDR